MGNLKNLPLPSAHFFILCVLYQFSTVGSNVGGGAGNDINPLAENKRENIHNSVTILNMTFNIIAIYSFGK